MNPNIYPRLYDRNYNRVRCPLSRRKSNLTRAELGRWMDVFVLETNERILALHHIGVTEAQIEEILQRLSEEVRRDFATYKELGWIYDRGEGGT